MGEYANPKSYLECVSNVFHPCVITARSVNQNPNVDTIAIQLCTLQCLLLSVKLKRVEIQSIFSRDAKFLPFKSRTVNLAKRRGPQFMFSPLLFISRFPILLKRLKEQGQGEQNYFHFL